jgi:uncharacterized protein
MSQVETSSAPSSAAGRSHLIDALRAIALFGVIMVNMAGITMIVLAQKMMTTLGPVDVGALLFQILFLFGKARAAFAFLFGVGFGIMLERAEQRGGDFRRMYMRRMLALFAFGVINQLFFFFGDILVNYALLGMALLLLRHMPDKMKVRLGAALIILPPLVAGIAEIIVGGPLPNFTGHTIAAASEMVSARGFEAYSSAHYTDVIAFNASWPYFAIAGNPVHRVVYNLSIFGLFLLGSLAARQRLLLDIEQHRILLKRALRWLLPVGLVLNLIFALGLFGIKLDGVLRGLVTASFSGPPILSLAFVAALALLFSQKAKSFQAFLAPAGRMALTNYLASGAIGTYCFYGYGLGWLGKINLAGISLFALMLYGGLLAFSHAWLSILRFGPAEWIWRSISYGSIQPMSVGHISERPKPQL